MDTHRATRRIVWLVLFGLAMGILEAAVVVYLRELYYPRGFRFPVVPRPMRVMLVELVREAMTLVMLLSVAVLEGRDGHDRFFVFGFLFGVWDLTYYAGLEVLLGWPESVGTWDILFLLPVPWLAPVLYPMVVSLLLIMGFAVDSRLRRRGRAIRLRPGSWIVASIGALLVIVSFCWRFRDVLEEKIPQRFPAPLFVAGILVALAPFAREVLRKWSPPNADHRRQASR